MDFRKRLREERLRQNLTQEQVAQKLGIERASYTQYESGRRTPALEMAKKISQILNCSLDYLVGNTNNIESFLNNGNPPTNPIDERYMNLLKKVKEANIEYELVESMINTLIKVKK